MNDDEFKEFLTGNPNYDRVPSALLDFSVQLTVEQDPQDPFSVLLMIRGQLATSGIPFPLFDFACTWYLHKTRRLAMERLQRLIPTEGLTRSR